MWLKIEKDFSNYNEFKDYCPKFFNCVMEKCTDFWDRVFTFIGFSIAQSINSDCTDVGPTPETLAKYITDCLDDESRALFSGNSDFDSILDEIKVDLNADDPVVALLAFIPTSMHYVNVVAVSENDDVAILDTDNSLYYYSKNDFEDLMDCRSCIPHCIISFVQVASVRGY